MAKVHKWQMTEEQRVAYIAKYPIRKTAKPKISVDSDFNQFQQMKEKRKAKQQQH